MKRLDGLQRISAWKCRFGDKTPVAIECTATLLEAVLMEESEDEPSRLQLIYSMAVIRFVNLLTGYLQTKGQAQPVVSLAKEIGLPEWIVELRHEASHKHMPPLAILKAAAKIGLVWLREYFWIQQCIKVPAPAPAQKKVVEEVVWAPNIDGVGGDITRLIIAYQQVQFKVIVNGAHSDGGKVTTVMSGLEHCLADPEARYLVIPLLLQDGYLVPTTEQLEALNIYQGVSTIGNITMIHKGLCRFWKPLVLLLDSLGFTPLLLQCIVKELGRFRLVGAKPAQYLMGWALQIIMAGTTDRRPFREYSMLYRNILKLPWNEVYEDCIRCPNAFTLRLLKFILPNVVPKPSEQTQTKVKHLLSVYCNALETQQPASLTSEDGTKALRIYTSEDILETVGENLSQGNKSSESSLVVEEKMEGVEESYVETGVLKEQDGFKPWSLSTAEVNWSKCPIGSIPGQPDDPNFLLLDTPPSENRKRLERSTKLQRLKSPAAQTSQPEPETNQPKPGTKQLEPETNQPEPMAEDDIPTEEHYWTKSELDIVKTQICIL
ncbi:ribosomal biogenesis protein LAS1L-like [Asterias rubens]|uniref:ribosomal biogenesis protein LAS1L-like n=1 Tax=Asterias rubens TaxID=7604 RepID=UPI0014552AEA|nr:ribosomal biogenesis protein LAS1L-like [Asterias rubens]